MKISTKLTVFFLILSVIPLGIVGAIAFENGRRALETETRERLTEVNLLKEAELNRWMQDNETLLNIIARRPSMRERVTTLAFLDEENPAYESAYEHLHEEHLDLWERGVEGGFESFFVLRASDGLILAATDKADEGKYRENKPYYIEGRRGTFISDIEYSIDRSVPVIHISTPIVDDNDNTIAVLVGRVSLEEMTTIMKLGSEQSASEETYLVNTFNFFVTESRFQPGDPLTQAIHTTGVQDCLAHNNGSGLYEDYRGVTVVGVYRWLPEWDLCILTEVDQTEALVHITRLRNAALAVGAVVALVAALVGVILSRSITEPIRQLVEGAQKIGKGDLDYQTNLNSRDEIGLLSKTLDQMAHNLKIITASRDDLDREVTRRKRTEEALEQQRGRFLTMLNNFPEVLYVADPGTYEVLFVNERFKKMLGQDPVGKPCYESFQGFEEPCQFCTNDIILKDKGRPYTWEYHNPVLKQDYQITDQVIEWPDGREVRFEVAINITARKQAEEELQVLNDALTRSNTELEQFAYVASHDLQEPLRVVVSYLQLLERRHKDSLNEDAQKYISRTIEASGRMKQLINDLLMFSRVSTRGAPFKPTDCEDILGQVLSNLEIAIKENDARITHDNLPVIMADTSQMSQLFQNLLSNAIKFRSQRPPEIHIGIERQDNSWQFSIHDNGIGIEPEYNERIFVIFQRLHTRREYSGTGIGLAVVKRIVERHGGHIWVESEFGQGSTFYFTIPDREEETP